MVLSMGKMCLMINDRPVGVKCLELRSICGRGVSAIIVPHHYVVDFSPIILILYSSGVARLFGKREKHESVFWRANTPAKAPHEN